MCVITLILVLVARLPKERGVSGPWLKYGSFTNANGMHGIAPNMLASSQNVGHASTTY